MKNIQLFNVFPSLPKPIRFLEQLAGNLWWTWNNDAIDLFRRIDPDLWGSTRHNPLKFFCELGQERAEELCEDQGFLTHMDAVRERFEAEVLDVPESVTQATHVGVAYFSLEFGIHESVRLYSGGLGCLAGDHLKSASDLGLPLAAVGLLYRQGYFQQYLDDDGWQQEAYPEIIPHHVPITKVQGPDNSPLEVSLPLPDGMLKAWVWRMDVGRIPLFLLDTNLPANPPEYRRITAQLYGGDRVNRIRQELLLGIGGVAALRAMGYEPRTYHMNEGHAAFLALGRMANLMQDRGMNVETAFEAVTRTNVFTTHTPVPAGNETFPVDLLKPHLDALAPSLGIDAAKVIAWGQAPGADPSSEVSMTILGLRFSNRCNAVSRLHGQVARRMWTHLWPEYPDEEGPIRHITNGVHAPSWLSADVATLFDRYLGSGWRQEEADEAMLARIDKIPDDVLWRAHELGKSRLIRAVREYGEHQYRARNAPRSQLDLVNSIFDQDALTLGFARRFSTYKRGTLLLKDTDRLKKLLAGTDCPVQFVFAGKAHPADHDGKNLIRQFVHFARHADVRHKVIFLENYDIELARYMVQGVDVWLNTPRRPQEASGTSGMKAAINGGLHCSILDGWWDEGYTPETGWAIGAGEEYEHTDYEDAVEAQALFNLIENQVIPMFFERPRANLPGRWVAMMKASIKMALGFFTTHRMVADYDRMFYQPALGEADRLMADDAAAAVALVQQRKRLESCWQQVSITLPTADRDLSDVHVGDSIDVTSQVQLGELRPDEVDVQVCYGLADSENVMHESTTDSMTTEQESGSGQFIYRSRIVCRRPGRFGLTARVVPKGDDWKTIIPGFMTWANHG